MEQGRAFRLSRLQIPVISGDLPDARPDLRLARNPPACPPTALARVDRHLKSRYIDAGRYPGTQLLVYRRGKIVHSSVQGYADLERKAPVKEDTIFRIYSMTKPITSVAFMMLVEEGRVAIDEPVHKYIPEWKNLGVFVAGSHPAYLTKPPARPMQIIDLLAPHLGPHLRLPAALQCRCRLSRAEDRRGGRRRTRWRR